MKNDTEKKILKIFQNVGYKNVSVDSNLRNDLKIDSLKLMVLIVEIEERFSVDSVEMLQYLDDVVTVQDVIKVVGKLRKEQNV